MDPPAKEVKKSLQACALMCIKYLEQRHVRLISPPWSLGLWSISQSHNTLRKRELYRSTITSSCSSEKQPKFFQTLLDSWYSKNKITIKNFLQVCHPCRTLTPWLHQACLYAGQNTSKQDVVTVSWCQLEFKAHYSRACVKLHPSVKRMKIFV